MYDFYSVPTLDLVDNNDGRLLKHNYYESIIDKLLFIRFVCLDVFQ